MILNYFWEEKGLKFKHIHIFFNNYVCVCVWLCVQLFFINSSTSYAVLLYINSSTSYDVLLYINPSQTSIFHCHLFISH